MASTTRGVGGGGGSVVEIDAPIASPASYRSSGGRRSSGPSLHGRLRGAMPPAVATGDGFTKRPGPLRGIGEGRDPRPSAPGARAGSPWRRGGGSHDAAAGACALAGSWRGFPPQTACPSAVVAPGVGWGRRGLGLEADGYRFAGPDDGIPSLVMADAEGDDRRTREPEPGARDRPQVAATLHARDVFGPVAGHLARGLPLPQISARRSRVRSGSRAPFCARVAASL